ncbi:MAG: Tex family protein [Balneolaceae bacterium]
MDDSQIFTTIAATLSCRKKQVETVVEFLRDGATIPFLARYRKEATGGLDEEQLRAIRDQLDAREQLENRRETILKTIREQEQLTDELERAIRTADDLKTLEDLYLPYKRKKKTKGDKAREKGLEPLAVMVWEQQTENGDPLKLAEPYVDADKELPDATTALQTALHIVAEWVNESVEVRNALRKLCQKHAQLTSRKNPAIDERTNYEDYYEFEKRIAHLRPHQILALNRGERENVLFVKLGLDEARTLDRIDDLVITNDRSVFTPHLQDAIEDAYKRLLFPAMEREVRSDLTAMADEHAILTFATNLKSMLMQPPLQGHVVMGIDPAYRTGCKVAVIDANGRYLEGTTIYPTPPQNKTAEAGETVQKLIDRHGVTLIAIGNGTASRETEQFVAHLLEERKTNRSNAPLQYLIVSEAGASVYSASPLAREEFPNLDASQRGNISIARRVLDPMAELIKIDPKSIGLGMYQHDINQAKLSRKLDDVVESCINEVGVNLNTASAHLLSHISGLSRSVAANIVAMREKSGRITSRERLKEVDGVGEFRFQQAAGFIRIPDAEHPFDNTAIHPESYETAEALCNLFSIDIHNLSGQADAIARIADTADVRELASQLNTGVPTLELILENLQKPGRDPREELPKPLLREDVVKMDDLSPGMSLQGTVRNVVDFGAFVDIGVKQDGLLHISEMGSGRRVENPHDEVAVGDILTVTITTIDKARGRIGLSLKG